jgi:hypothetical protein
LAGGSCSRSSLKDADLVLEHAVTGETVMVHVKSTANQAMLDDYVARFEQVSLSRLFFVCHSPRGLLDPGDRPEVHVWTRDELAANVLRHGLFDWLVARAA